MRFFDVAILANAVCIGLDFDSAEWFFLSLFCVEIAIRMYAYGFWEFFSIHRLWNWFDFLIIFSTVIATIAIGRYLKNVRKSPEREIVNTSSKRKILGTFDWKNPKNPKN